MYVRMNMLAGDPGRLDEATRYMEETVRPHVEGLHGNRGLACLINADLGVCVVASYWDTHDAMTASEQAVEVSRKEVTQLAGGTVAVEATKCPSSSAGAVPRAGPACGWPASSAFPAAWTR
jgi:heme-degrading monooxygenase HmoA